MVCVCVEVEMAISRLPVSLQPDWDSSEHFLERWTVIFTGTKDFPLSPITHTHTHTHKHTHTNTHTHTHAHTCTHTHMNFIILLLRTLGAPHSQSHGHPCRSPATTVRRAPMGLNSRE